MTKPVRAAVIIAVTCLVLGPCVHTYRKLWSIEASEHVSPVDLAECASKMEVTFPNSFVPLGVCRIHDFLIEDLLLKGTVASTDVPRLIEKSPLSRRQVLSGKELEKSGSGRRIVKGVGWWDLSSMESPRMVSGPNGQYKHVELWVADGEPTTVYLIWHFD